MRERHPSDLVATTNSKDGNSFITIDVTDPSKPAQKAFGLAGFHKRQVKLLNDLSGLALAGPNPCKPGSSPTFTGDLAVTTSFTIDFTYLSVFDVTDLAAPCRITDKVLTATPDLELFEVLQQGTYHVFGLAARGLATIKHSQGIAAYAAIAEAGLFFVDVGSNIPEKRPRTREPMLPGDYHDVAAHAGRLLALNRTARQMEVIDPSLAVIAVLPLPDLPRRIVVTPGFPFDVDADGTVESGEAIDAAFIGGEKSLLMADVSNIQAPKMVGRIPLPAMVRELDVDPFRRRALVVDISTQLLLLDVSRMQAGNFLDRNLDGIDDRISWSRQLTDEGETVRFDPERMNFYVGTEKGLEVYGFGAPNLRGTARYTYIPVNPDNEGGRKVGLDYDNSSERPIRGAIVELRNAAGSLLQTTTTDDTGYYSFDAPPGAQVEVVVKAALGTPNNIHFDVIDNVVHEAQPDAIPPTPANPQGNRVWSKSSCQKRKADGTCEVGLVTVGAATRVDIVAESEWTYHPSGLIGQYTKRDGAAFAILDTVYQAEKVVRLANPGIVFPLLHMAWSPDNRPALQPQPNGPDAHNYAAGFISDAAHYSETNKTIYLHGRQNLETDEYDVMVILHEWSHYFTAKFSRADSIAGTHNVGDDLDLRVAFDEGFATAHAGMLTGKLHYIDTSGKDQSDVYAFDIEHDDHSPNGFFREDSVVQLLWDLFDPAADFENPDSHVKDPQTDPVIEIVPDEVELGYLPVYQAMTGAHAKTRAFTSLISFLKALLSLPAPSDPVQAQAVKDAIVSRARAENLDLTQFDEFELATPKHRMYTVLPVDGTLVTLQGPGPYEGHPLRTRRGNDPDRDNNKLENHVFFKFTVAEAGTYEFEVTPLAQAFMKLTLNDGGKMTAQQADALGGQVKLVTVLLPGDYSAAVHDASVYGGAGYPRTCCLRFVSRRNEATRSSNDVRWEPYA